MATKLYPETLGERCNVRHKHVIDAMEDRLYYTAIRELQEIIKMIDEA